MKEQLLNEGDRAALQGLIPLAGALGAGTIFALFFGGRRPLLRELEANDDGLFDVTDLGAV